MSKTILYLEIMTFQAILLMNSIFNVNYSTGLVNKDSLVLKCKLHTNSSIPTHNTRLHSVRCSQFSFQALRTHPQGCQGCQKIKNFMPNQILAVWSANIQSKLKKRKKREKWPKKPLFLTIFWKFTQFQLNLSAANQQIYF